MRRARLLLLLPLLLLTACGFQLRGSQPLPEALKVVAVQVPTEERALVPPLNRELEARGAQVVPAGTPGSALVRVEKARFEQRILSLATDGSAREYELFYNVDFRLQTPDGALRPPRRVSVLRDYSYDKARVLGKEAESVLLKDEMRREAAGRIVEQLAH